MNMHYVLELWEPAAPAFCSFSKSYVGTKLDMLTIADAIARENPEDRTANAIREYFGGNRSATHNIAYREIPVLTPVRVLAAVNMRLPERSWEHLNIWKCPYRMKFSSAEVSQIVIRYEGMYRRFVRARIFNLCFNGIGDEWEAVGSAFWGNACILKTKSHSDGQTTFENILYVQEDAATDKDSLIQKLTHPESVILDKLCDEIFGDG